MMTMLLSLCGFVQLVPSVRSEFTTTDYLTVCWSTPPSVHSLTHWLGISTVFLTGSSSKSGSEWVNMVWRIGPLCLVYGCPCVTLCVCFTSISMWTSTERRGLCYCCNELGICSPCALSPRLIDKWSCMVSCPLLPLPSANSARSVRPRMWRDWPTILGATCQSAHADWLPLCAGTGKRKLELSPIHPNIF